MNHIEEMPEAARLQAIFESRARALARPAEKAENDGKRDFIILSQGRDRYLIDVACIAEIQASVPVTPVPGLPGHWKGIARHRGRLTAVLDLGAFLAFASGRPEKSQARSRGDTLPGPMIFVSLGALSIALSAEILPALARVDCDQILEPIGRNSAGRAPAISGMTPEGYSLLDMKALLSDPRLAVRDDYSRSIQDPGAGTESEGDEA